MMTRDRPGGDARPVPGIRRTDAGTGGRQGDKGRREVSVTAVLVAEDDGLPEGPVPRDGSFLDSLVARLSAQYGVDSRAVRSRAVEVLASFAGARVQAFVPLLVEKRLRDTFRGRSGLGTIPAAQTGSTAVTG